MTGYTPQRKLYRLKFADREYEGLEVLAGSASMGSILEIQRLAGKMGEKPTPEESAEISSRMMNIFGKALRSWNVLDEDDQLVPATTEGLLTQDPDFVMALVAAWTQAVAGVSTPLADGSSSGETSQEASLLLGSSSQSLEN